MTTRHPLAVFSLSLALACTSADRDREGPSRDDPAACGALPEECSTRCDAECPATFSCPPPAACQDACYWGSCCECVDGPDGEPEWTEWIFDCALECPVDSDAGPSWTRVNEFPDRRADASAGERTLLVRHR